MNDPQVHARPYYRTPSVSPDGAEVAFVYAGDIWRVALAGGAAERMTANPAGHAWPRWSPDGSQIAFSSSRSGASDIYLLPLRAGEPRRITFHESGSVPEDWSPDGAHLFFRSAHEQQGSVIYRVPVAGGTPTPWISQPYENLEHVACSPDGQTLAFNLTRDRWWRRGPNPYGGAELWLVSSAPGADDYRKLSGAPGLNRWPMWAADGGGLYFVSDRDGIENIWFQPTEGGSAARKITHFTEGRLLWPTISRDSTTIVFERDCSIWRLDLASGAARAIPIAMASDTRVRPAQVQICREGLSELRLAPDGRKIAFVVRGEVFADFADKETDKEQRGGPAFRVTDNAFRDSDICWSPDSRRLAYTSDRLGDEEVFSYDFVTRAETKLTSGPGPKHQPRYSPDGAWLAYARGGDEIRLIDLAANADRLFARTQSPASAEFCWSPDSRWLAFFAQDKHWFSNLYVQRVDESAARQITFLSNKGAHSPIWSPDGRFIIFTNEGYATRVDLRPPTPFFREAEFEKLFEAKEPRSGVKEPKAESPDPPPDCRPLEPPIERGRIAESEPAPAPPPAQPPANGEQRPADKQVEIVFEGIERRLRLITPPSISAHALCISPDSRDLIFHATVAGKSNLWSLSLDEPRQDLPPRQLTISTAPKSEAQFAPEGKSYYYLDNGQVVTRKFPSGDPVGIPVVAEVTIDFNLEKRQIFDEGWRLLRDYFYDPTFRGLDWSEARRQFAPLAAGAQTRDDLYAVLNLMVGELRASHLGAFPRGSAGQQAYIGLQFDPAEQARSGRLLVAAVIPDGPVALASNDAKVGAGDELLAVNDVGLGPHVSLDQLLLRTAGRRVLLRLAPRDGGPARELAVRPIGPAAYDYLRYRAWVYANEAYVHRISGGRLGYVHIQTMEGPAYRQFLADLDSETYSKAGVVIDVRFNPGGHTAFWILDILARRSVLLKTFRDRPPIDAGYFHGSRLLNRPTVLMINEKSLSNAEVLAEGYRRLGLGKVIGRPSGGAVIDQSFVIPTMK